MIVTRPMLITEPDLLKGHEQAVLWIVDLDGRGLAQYSPPSSGWTHETLELIGETLSARCGWEAYLNNQWVGSSEV